MAKTVYSLVLSDDVIAAVDALAAAEGCSRSALVNHVLAEYASMQTPEKRNRQTLLQVQQMAGQYGLRGTLSGGRVLTMQTAVRYKYNPALQYVLELWDRPQQVGRIKVALRSQNASLLSYMGLFFNLWQKLEQSHLPHSPQGEVREDGRQYHRILRQGQQDQEDAQDGLAISEYVRTIDECMKVFFSNLDDASQAVQETEECYVAALRKTAALAQL